ncbi:MAG: hypothetical protein RR581_00705, partial [Eubacterium sp.]
NAKIHALIGIRCASYFSGTTRILAIQTRCPLDTCILGQPYLSGFARLFHDNDQAISSGESNFF